MRKAILLALAAGALLTSRAAAQGSTITRTASAVRELLGGASTQEMVGVVRPSVLVGPPTTPGMAGLGVIGAGRYGYDSIFSRGGTVDVSDLKVLQQKVPRQYDGLGVVFPATDASGF